MSSVEWSALTAGAERLELEGGYSLRLLSAQETLEARAEGSALTREGVELALCTNACLLARAFERGGKAVFTDGQAALKGLTVRQIGALAQRWAEFDRVENPSARQEQEVQTLKKAWSTRQRSGCVGVCSGHFAPCPPNNG